VSFVWVICCGFALVVWVVSVLVSDLSCFLDCVALGFVVWLCLVALRCVVVCLFCYLVCCLPDCCNLCIIVKGGRFSLIVMLMY